MKSPSIAIIGAAGEMARGLLSPLLEGEATLISVDRAASEAEKEEAFSADIIIFSTSRSVCSGYLDGRTLDARQLLVDICSLKGDILIEMAATGADFLSLHPMNGPTTNFSNQVWLQIPNPTPAGHARDWFLNTLQRKGISFLEVRSAEEHDELMAYLLGYPELATRFFEPILKRVQDLLPQSDTSSLRCAPPAFITALFGYAYTVLSTEPWLRKELAENLLQQSRLTEVFKQVQQPVTLEGFVRQNELASKLFDDEPNLLAWVRSGSDWWRGSQVKEEKECSLRLIKEWRGAHPRDAAVVGIHGLFGSFTDEAWHRFQAQSFGRVFHVKELVHAASVVSAVSSGSIDYGVIAVANSGSGAYEASMEALAHHHVEIRAIFNIPIEMCLLCHPDVNSVSEIDTLFGHPVALSQCEKTLDRHYPSLRRIKASDEMDTALSAKLLSEGGLPKSYAVFASRRAAEMFSLRILHQGVHHDPNNTTSFVVVAAPNS